MRQRALTFAEAERARRRQLREMQAQITRLRRVAAQDSMRRIDLSIPDEADFADDDDYEVGDGS